MSVYDSIAYTADEAEADSPANGRWYQIAFATASCLLIVIAWISQVANLSQIIAGILALSLGLIARAVLKVDDIDGNGIKDQPPLAEMLLGAATLGGLAAVYLIAASGIFAPLVGTGEFVSFMVAFAAIFPVAIALKAVLSAMTCCLATGALEIDRWRRNHGHAEPAAEISDESRLISSDSSLGRQRAYRWPLPS